MSANARPQAVLHVSLRGNDRDSGTAEKPFATVERAQAAARELAPAMKGDVVVEIGAGTYQLAKPLRFGPEDSGTNGHDVVYRAKTGEGAGANVVLSGGRRLEGWSAGANGIWTAALDMSALRQLYVGGKRAPRASIAAPAGLEEWGNVGYRTQNDAVADWSHPEDIELVYTDMWVYTYCKLKSIKRSGRSVEIRMQQPSYTLAYAREGRPLQGCYPLSVENSLSFLREPGQWYFDPRLKLLSYKPRDGEDPARLEVVAPVAEKLLEIRGTVGQPVHNLRFEGITFAEAGWLTPSERGLIDLQANFTMGPETRLHGRHMPPSELNPACLFPYHGECTRSPAAVVVSAGREVRFRGCAFTRLGGAGLDVERGSSDVEVERCELSDIAGSGIQVGDIQLEDHHPSDPRLVVRGIAIRDCLFHHVAQDYKGGVGVFAGYTQGTSIEHCEFRDLPYSAISLGWGWGEVDAGGGGYVQPDAFDTPTPCASNRVEGNHIHDVMLELWDGGAIYTLGEMPGTVIRANHVHDTRGFPGGIYLDEGSGHIEVSGNVVYNTPAGSPRGHHGARPLNFNNRAQNRISTCPVRGNHTDGPGAPDFPRDVVAAAGPRR